MSNLKVECESNELELEPNEETSRKFDLMAPLKQS